MFTNWGFLISHIWVLMLIALIAGLIAGWLIFGSRK